MSGELRTCRIAGCETEHKRRLFCCGPHWSALPKHMRHAIWSAYRRHGVLSLEYHQAAENAEAFLEGRNAEDVAA